MRISGHVKRTRFLTSAAYLACLKRKGCPKLFAVQSMQHRLGLTCRLALAAIGFMLELPSMFVI